MGLQKLANDWTGLEGIKVFKECKECIVHRTRNECVGESEEVVR
jgi:hypothetical protein